MALYHSRAAALMTGMVAACFGLGVAHAATIFAQEQDLPFPLAHMIRVGDRLNLPLPPHAPGTAAKSFKQVSPEQAGAAVTASIEAKFVQATGSADNLLTKKAARASGWGWAADHFAEIDRQSKGKVSLNDVLDYVNQRSSLTLPRVSAD